ncbi:MAG TPA: cation:proton antiporter [Nitrospiria bacterium]
MPQIHFLHDLVIIFGCAIVVVVVFQRLHLPSIIGFLITGALLGPSGVNLIADIDQVRILAEVGVVMLLFTIGLEFSLTRLSRVRAFALSGGALQVGITILLATLAALAAGTTWREGIFWGFLLSLSSTAIVLKILIDRSELDAPHGRLSIGILIFQDLVVVPMMLLIPVLAGGGGTTVTIVLALGKSILLLAGVLIAALWVVPRALRLVVQARSREIFVIAIILICLGVAWMTSWIGLSLAIGAFIAGLVISESDYGHQALADIIPFRDSFNSLFFVSIGILLDLRMLSDEPLLLFGLAVGVLLVKGLVASGVTVASGYPLRVAALVGLALPQVGEFSFVMAQAGQAAGLLVGRQYQIFLAISIITMVLTPFLIQLGPFFTRKADSLHGLQRWLGRRRPSDLEPHSLTLRDHVIIAGYGFNGRNLARVLREAGIPYVVVDLHDDLVRHGRLQGDPIYFGDVTRAEVLRQLNIRNAKILVLAVSDPFALRRAVQVARQINAQLHIVTRIRYLKDLDELFRLGADEVVPEEFESALQIMEMVMKKYQIMPGQIAKRQAEIRREGYAKLSRWDAEPYMAKGVLPAEVEVMRHALQEGCSAVGRTLADLGLSARTGAMVVAVIRGEETLSSPGGSFRLLVNDIVVLVGTQDEINRTVIYLNEECGPAIKSPEPEGPRDIPKSIE